MKAAILNGYNKNGCDLEIKDIPVPEISENEVLVKIRTAGVNPLDNMIIHGEVKLLLQRRRIIFPMKKLPVYRLRHSPHYRHLS